MKLYDGYKSKGEIPGGGNSHIKRTGLLSEILKRTPYEVPRSCFVRVAWIFFHPKEVTILKQHFISCQIFLRLCTLKSTRKAPAVNLLWLNTLRGTKTAFLTPKRYNKHPCPFYIGVPARDKTLLTSHNLQIKFIVSGSNLRSTVTKQRKIKQI